VTGGTAVISGTGGPPAAAVGRTLWAREPGASTAIAVSAATAMVATAARIRVRETAGRRRPGRFW